MPFQRIRIKNSNVANRVPTAAQLDTAELCINLRDQKLYSKDADGNIFELGKTAVNNGDTPPGTGNEIGDLWWDGDNLLVWNGSSWEVVGAVTSVNGETGDVVLELGDLDDVDVSGAVDGDVLVYNGASWEIATPADLAIDVDLDYTAAADGGTVTNTAGDNATLPLVDSTNAGLMSPADFDKLGGMPSIIAGENPPGTPSLGDIWIDTKDCPPTINIWNDCDDPGNPIWTPIGGGELPGCQQGPVSITSSNGTELNSTLTAQGGTGLDEGALLPAPTYEWTGPNGFTATGSAIVAAEEGVYTVTATVTCTDTSTLSTSASTTIVDSYVDMANQTAPIIAVVGEGLDGAYEGNTLFVVTNATVINGINPAITETQWYRDGISVATGALYELTAADTVGSVITARQLFTDDRTNTLLSEPSNGITILDRPADAITFTPAITDDGSQLANTPTHVLTADAGTIVGGTAPIEYGFVWKSAGTEVGVTTKTYTIQNSDIGNVISCDVTVAEPDGSNAETRTATYAQAIVNGASITQPRILSPEDGAGLGDGTTTFTETSEITGVVTTNGDNGDDWTQSSFPSNGGIEKISRQVTSLGNRTIAFDRVSGHLFYNDSNDLSTGWVQASGTQTIHVHGIVTQGKGTVLAIGNTSNNEFYSSTDGDTWTQETPSGIGSDLIQSGFYCTSEDRFYIASRSNYYKSNVGDFTTWTDVTGNAPQTAYDFFEVVDNDDHYVISSCKGGIAVSRNGSNFVFKEIPQFTASSSNAVVVYAQGQLLAYEMQDGTENVAHTSTNFGDTWTKRNVTIDFNLPNGESTTNFIRKILFVNNEYIAAGHVGSNLHVIKSSNGLDYTQVFGLSNTTLLAFGGMEYSASGLVLSTTGAGSNGFWYSSLNTTTLEFADNTNFGDFEVYGTYNEVAGTKSAQVLSKDSSTSTMVVSTEDTFVANADEKLVSRTEVTNANPDADTLIFTATPYEDTPDGQTTPGTATWDVATSADFSTGLMTDTKAVVRDVNNSLEPSERVNITLEADTEYYTRVTYTNNDGSLSAVSRTHHFKTGTGYVEPDPEIEYVAFSEEQSSTTSGSGNIKATYPASMADCNYLVALVWVDTPNNVRITSTAWDKMQDQASDRPVAATFTYYREGTFADIAGMSPNNMFICDGANSYGVNIMMFGFKVTGSSTRSGGSLSTATTTYTPNEPGASFIRNSVKYYGVFANSARPIGGTCTLTNVGNQSTANRNNNVSEARGRMTSKLLGSDGAPAANDYKFDVTYSNKGVIGSIWVGATATSFYNENTGTVMTESQLAGTYGRNTSLPELGIYELTEQPTYEVDTYVKRDGKYHPIRDYTTELEDAQNTIDTLQTRLAGIEADEIVDDATDDTLLTSLASLLERVEALEEGGT